MSSKRLNTEVAKPRCCGHAGRMTLPILPDLVGTRVPARPRWQGLPHPVMCRKTTCVPLKGHLMDFSENNQIKNVSR